MHSKTTSATSYARFSDGATALAKDCAVGFTDKGVSVSFDDGSPTRQWPFDSLRTGEPIRSHSIDTLLTSNADPGATVFVPGAEFAAQLVAKAPHLSARAQRIRHVTPWLAVAALFASLIGAAYVFDWSPARALAKNVPASWLDRLGDAAVGQLAHGQAQCISDNGKAALAVMQRRLSDATGEDTTFRVDVYDLPVVNAFAVPGNRIIISRALIQAAQSPEEIAGVLAHEMGHGIERHPETGVIRTLGMAAAIELMLGGSGSTMGRVGLMLAQLGYTRTAEREADLQALRILKAAEISPRPLADFFSRVEGISRNRKGDKTDAPEKTESADKVRRRLPNLDLLRTHPAARERAAQILKQPKYPTTPVLSAAQWTDLRAICGRKQRVGDSAE